MRHGYGSMAVWLLILVASWAVPNIGSGSQCRERKLEKGSVEEAPGSQSDRCWCGLFIREDYRVCPTKVIVRPNRYTCAGPVSEERDCAVGGAVFIEEITQRCSKLMASVSLTVMDTGVTFSFPVCVGTFCEVTGRTPIGYLLSAIEIPCAQESDQ